MQECAQCGKRVERRFRFCPWCAAPLRRKLVEFFPAHPRDAGKALRVSRYLHDDPHVRFSVWDDTGRAEAAVSLDEATTARLARFLRPPATPGSKRWFGMKVERVDRSVQTDARAKPARPDGRHRQAVPKPPTLATLLGEARRAAGRRRPPARS